MKGVTIILLCVLAAVQGRVVSSDVEETSLKAPWLVHLRFSRLLLRGRLDTCVGTLYNNRWVITTATCLSECNYGEFISIRFIWLRYDTQNVFRPGFVTESTLVKVHPDYDIDTGANNIGLIDLGRKIELTDKIQPIALAAPDAEVPTSGRACGYGEEKGEPGEDLFCVDVTLTEDDGLLAAKAARNASKYDLGAALVSDDKVYGILVRTADENSQGAFLPTSKYVAWIEEETAEEEPEDVDENDSILGGDDIIVAEPFLTF